jgi:hypothetical protein
VSTTAIQGMDGALHLNPEEVLVKMEDEYLVGKDDDIAPSPFLCKERKEGVDAFTVSYIVQVL